jgi:threonine dehydrogenase-like Zn-dependent dehydrogenase
MALQEVPEPDATPEQAVIRVEVVGICGSDFHLFSGHHPYARFPQVQGHEVTGIVEALPAGYDGPARVGERVVVDPTIPCGACYPCRHGHPNCCAHLQVMGAHTPGALSDLAAVRASGLHPVGGLEPTSAALVEPVTIGLQTVLRSGLADGDAVVVLGAGPIGQTVVLAAAERGARVAAVDRIPGRLALAGRFGAELALDSNLEDVTTRVRDWTDGDGAAVVVDATGVPELIRLAFDLVAASGTICIVGISDREVSIPVIEFTRKEINVRGSRNSTGIFPDAIEFVRRNEPRLRELITHEFPFDRTQEAIEFAMSHPDEATKVLINFGSGS